MHPRELVVETPEKIVIRHALASPGARAAAWILDSLIQFIATIAGFAILAYGAGDDLFGERANVTLGSGLSVAFYLILLFLLKWGYYVFFETLTRGGSPGKRAMGIRAVRIDGEPIDFESVVVRNLVRVVDDFPGIPLLGFLVSISTKRSQRLGDIAAGTVVVIARGRKRPALPEEAPIDASSVAIPMLARGGTALTERELGVLRRFLAEKARLPEAAVRSMSARLAAQAAERTGVPVEGRDPVEYIESIYLAHGTASAEPGGAEGKA